MSGAKTGKDGVVAEGKSLREKLTHIIDQETGLPLWVGPGQGDYTYEDAKDISRQFLASRSRGAAAGVNRPADSIDQGIRIAELITAKSENAPPPKNTVTTIAADGSHTTQEVDPSRPIIIEAKPTPPAGPTGVAGMASQMSELQQLITLLSGLGLVRLPGTPGEEKSQHKYIVIDKDGKQIESTGGQPIIIYRDQPSAAPNPMSSMPVTITGADGKPVTVGYDQLQQFFAIEEWKDKRRREEDKHAGHMELVSTFKDLAKKGAAALQDVVSSKGEEATK
jgi:hypothetical protein